LAHIANPVAAQGPSQSRTDVRGLGGGRIFPLKNASNLLGLSGFPGSGFPLFLMEVRYPTW
jgi:hypothetical protein